MRLRTAALVTFTAGAAAAAAVWWRRRGAAPATPAPVQLGLNDGSVHTLPAGDTALAELDALAAAVRSAFESAA